MSLSNGALKESAILLEQTVIILLHPLNHYFLHLLQESLVVAVEGQQNGICIVDLLWLHFLILLKQLLLLGLRHPTKLEQL